MKIISFVGTLPPVQGISSYCRELVGELQNHAAIEFITFSTFAPRSIYTGKQDGAIAFSDATWKNVKVRRVMAWYNPFSWIAAGMVLKGKVVHIQWWSYLLFPALFTLGIVAKLRGMRIVTTVHNVFSHESNILDRLCARLQFSISDSFIVHSEVNKKEFLAHYFITPSRVHVIPHGILSFYGGADTVSKSAARKKLAIAPSADVVLLFGNTRPYKGIEDILHAFDATKKKIPHLHVLIVGSPWNEKYAETIRKMAAGKKGIQLHLHYVEEADVKDYFSAADLVVLPYRDFSSQSGVGNVALAFEKPLLVSDAGALPELVKNPAAVFPAGDTHALAQRLIAFFSSPKLQSAMKHDSKIKRAEYGWESIAEKTHAVYREAEGS